MVTIDAPEETTAPPAPGTGVPRTPEPAWSDHPPIAIDEEIDEDEAYFLGDEDDDDDIDYDDDEFDEFDDELEEDLDEAPETDDDDL